MVFPQHTTSCISDIFLYFTNILRHLLKTVRPCSTPFCLCCTFHLFFLVPIFFTSFSLAVPNLKKYFDLNFLLVLNYVICCRPKFLLLILFTKIMHQQIIITIRYKIKPNNYGGECEHGFFLHINTHYHTIK